MKIRFYHIFSNWIFIASIILAWFKLSIYPLHIIAIPFGISYLITTAHRELLAKELITVCIHFLPFLWAPRDVSFRSFTIAVWLTITYIVFMMSIGVRIVDIYKAVYAEHHTGFGEFMRERWVV